MKILQIGQLPKEAGGNYTTGAANVVWELSKQKVDSVIRYTYATNTKHEAAEKLYSYKNEYIGYTVNPFAIAWDFISHPCRTIREWRHYKSVDHINPLRLAFYRANIAKAINDVQPDMIHVHSISNLSSTAFARNGKKIPILLTCHGIFFRGDESPKEDKDLYLGNIGLADYYSGLTQESLTEYEKYLGIPKEEVTVIPNGVDCKKFYFSEEERIRLRTAMGVPEDTKVLITVASVQERKGQLAFTKILERMPDLDCQYWIVGSGPDVEKIEMYVREHGLTDRVKLLGCHSAEELYKYYSAADVYAHVSTMEGQALCEIEAFACGMKTLVRKEIVGTLVADVQEKNYLVIDFDSFDTESIKSWISEAYDKESRTNYDWSAIARLYVNVYQRIMDKNRLSYGLHGCSK